MKQEQLEPQMNADERRINEITDRVIGCAYKVANTLGAGFLERIYENALAIELAADGLSVQQQFPIQVRYRGQPVGDYTADLLVEGCVVLELKAVRAFEDVHIAQCLNYLSATGLKLCLLINFSSPSIEIKRIVNKL